MDTLKLTTFEKVKKKNEAVFGLSNPQDISLETNYLKKWLDVQSLGAQNFFEKTILKEGIEGDYDCEKKEIKDEDKCDPPCKRRIKVDSTDCVHESKINYLNQFDTFKGRYSKEVYTVVGKELIHTVKEYDDKIIRQVQIYYYLFKSKTDDQYIILFPAGNRFINEIFNDEKEINDFFDKIFLPPDVGTKLPLIVCGHSMGCFLSLVYSKYIEAKEINHIVIGSGPITLGKFGTSSDNIKKYIFVNIFVNNVGIKEKYYIDPFTKGYYLPVIYALESDQPKEVNLITEDKLENDLIVVDWAGVLHKWNNYYDNITTIIKPKSGGKRRNDRRRNRKGGSKRRTKRKSNKKRKKSIRRRIQ